MPGLLLASALAFTQGDANLAYLTATNLVACHTPRDAGTARAAAAASFIADAAEKAGAKVAFDKFSSRTPKGPAVFTNVSAEFGRREGGEWVVFVSHYDTKPGSGCPGANDGASTTGLLVALAHAFARSEALPLNAMLVWTDGEECMESYSAEDGLWGSKRAADRLRRDGRPVRAVVCLDMLGDRNLDMSIPWNSSPELRGSAIKAAKAAGLAPAVKAAPEHVIDDHVPFLERGFKAIDLIDFHYGSAPGLNDWWHTPHDTPDKISEASLLKAGRLAVALVAELSDANRAENPAENRRD